MADLNSLGFTPDEEIPADDIADIPEPTGGFEFLQPGRYTFILPPAEKGFTEADAVEAGFAKKLVGSDGKEYVQFTFRGGQNAEGEKRGYPLKVKNGGMYGTQLNNMPRIYQGKKANDLLLLLKALGETETPKTNLQYIKAILKHAGASFGARQQLTARASQQRDGFEIRFADWVAPGETYTGKTGNVTHGLPKDENGNYPEEINVTNPNTGVEVSLRVFGNIGDFYSVKNGHA